MTLKPSEQKKKRERQVQLAVDNLVEVFTAKKWWLLWGAWMFVKKKILSRTGFNLEPEPPFFSHHSEEF